MASEKKVIVGSIFKMDSFPYSCAFMLHQTSWLGVLYLGFHTNVLVTLFWHCNSLQSQVENYCKIHLLAYQCKMRIHIFLKSVL